MGEEDKKKFLNKEGLDKYHEKVDTKMKTKVDRSVKDDQNATNTIDNQKGQNGCVMQSHLADTDGTVVSFNTASENGPDGILAQVYAKNTTGADAGKGMRLNFKKTGAYYGVGDSTPTDAAHELAVKGDINKAYEIELDLDDGHWKKEFDAAVVGESLDVIWNNIKTGKAMVKATFDDNGFAYTAELFGFMVFGGQAYVDAVALETPGTTDEIVKNYHAQIEYVSKGGDVSLTVSIYKASDIVEFISADFTHDTSVSPVTEWTGTIGNTESDPSIPKKMWNKLCEGKLLPKITTDGYGVIIGDPDQKYDFNFTRLTVNLDPADPTDLYLAVLQAEMIGKKLNAAGDEETANFRLDVWYEADDTIPEYKIMGKITIIEGPAKTVDIELTATAAVPYPIALLDQDVVDNIFATMPPLNVTINTDDGKTLNATMQSYVKDNTNERITANLKVIWSIGTSAPYEFTTATYAMAILKTPVSITGIGDINAVLERIEAICDDVSSDSSIRPLSAGMGKYLNGRIDGLLDKGRLLGYWNNLTGKAHNPVIKIGFPYREGDYYIIETLGTTKQLTPYGITYSENPSTIEYVGTKEVQTGMFWVFRKDTWELESSHTFMVEFANIAGHLADSPQLVNEFDKKVDKDNTLSATIGTTWGASGDLFTQVITVAGMAFDDKPVIAFVNTGVIKSAVEAQKEEAAKIYKIDCDTNKIIVYATEATTQELSILIKKV